MKKKIKKYDLVQGIKPVNDTSDLHSNLLVPALYRRQTI